MALSQEKLDSFHQNGYLRYGKILEDEEIELLGKQYDLEFEKSGEDKSCRNIAGDDMDAIDDAPQRTLQIMQMCERNIHFRRLLYNDKILDVVEDLMGPNIQLFHDQALFKPAREGGAVGWHQDNGYWMCRPSSLVSCWLTLDDVDNRNGAMQVIPGSHLMPVWHEPSEESTALLEISNVDTSSAVTIDLPAGGCMFHHCQTVHYTGPNATEFQRRAHAIHFMQPGTRMSLEGLASEGMGVSFKRPLLRARV